MHTLYASKETSGKMFLFADIDSVTLNPEPVAATLDCEWESFFGASAALPKNLDEISVFSTPAAYHLQMLLHLCAQVAAAQENLGKRPLDISENLVSVPSGGGRFDGFTNMDAVLFGFTGDFLKGFPGEVPVTSVTFPDLERAVRALGSIDEVTSMLVPELHKQPVWDATRERPCTPSWKLYAAAGETLSVNAPEATVMPPGLHDNLLTGPRASLRGAAVAVNLALDSARFRANEKTVSMTDLDGLVAQGVGISVTLPRIEAANAAIAAGEVAVGEEVVFSLPAARKLGFDPLSIANSVRRIPLFVLLWTGSDEASWPLKMHGTVPLPPDGDWNGDAVVSFAASDLRAAKNVLGEMLYIDLNTVSNEEEIIAAFRERGVEGAIDAGRAARCGFGVHAFPVTALKPA